MSLEGAKLVCLDEAGNHGQIILAKGRKFTMGYYVNCDFVLVDERAKGVHCEIECDAFGRVTIRNLSPDNPILVNGSSVEIKRILLNNTKISILDKEYLWLFPKSSSNEFEDICTEATSTPQKTVGIPEQPPNSCPDFKLHRDLPKRFTVHNFAYCIQSDEEGNISSQSNNEDTETNETPNENKSEDKVETQQNDVTKESSENSSQAIDLDKIKEERKRSVTPEPNKEMVKSTAELLETPKLDLINSTKDKENKSTQKKSKQLLTMCHHSDLVITSFSPRETGVKIERSFVTIIKPKVQVTKSASTPKSVYSTPKSDIAIENVDEQDNENERELTFHTPSTSKKATATTAPAKVLTTSSMHIIDLTTPHKKRAVSPYLKSALKASAKKNLSPALEKPRTKLAFDEHSHLSALPATPVTIDGTTATLETPPSVISVDSSTDNSSVIEELSDRSNVGVTPRSATGLSTPLKTKNLAVASCTPKRTPQSLMKRAILTSAKKQINTQNPATSRRESINRIPLRNKLPVTPQASVGNLSSSQLPRRQSMSTPTRKSVMSSAFRFFDNSPSTSKLVSASPTLMMSSSKTNSSLNVITTAKALSTSTPISMSTNNSGLRSRSAAYKTSSLHKVRKSFGNVTLSSHISKASTSASASKLTSIKNKPPQQIMSDRLITKARKSWCFTPISSRSRNMVANAKTPPQKTCPSSILKDKTAAQSVKKPDRTPAVLFADNDPLDTSNESILSRTFTIDSDTEENTDSKKQNQNPLDTTFSPEKILNKTERPIKKLEKEQQAIETPLDVEEVVDLAKENESCESKVDNKENNTPLPDSDRIKSIVTEESFAEVINDFKEQHNLPPIFEISDSQRESSSSQKNESQESFAEDVKNKKDTAEDVVKTTNQDIDKTAETDVAEIGFGEESTEDRNERNEETANKIENVNNKSKMREENPEECVEKDITADDIKSLDVEVTNKVVVDLLKCDETKSYEYKPIVEDITLEDSIIEKETKENDKMNVSKQPLYEDITLENSLVEEKIKSEEIKEEINEKVTKENTEKLSSSTNTNNVCDNLEPKEGDTSSDNIRKDLIIVDQYEIIEKPQINQNALESLETNQIDNNIEINTEISEISQHFDICDNAAPDNVAQQATQGTEDTEEASKLEDQSSAMVANRLDDDIEDTNKLLEEIEDVLNKSDEIKQKQNLIETEKDSETTPLTESEKLLSQTIEMLDDRHDSNVEDLQQSSSSAKFSAKSRSEVTSQEEDTEKSAEITNLIIEENSKKESSIIETFDEREEHSTFCIDQLDEFNCNEEESESKIERSEEEIQETNISQSKNNEEMIYSSDQKNTETDETNNVIEIDRNFVKQSEERTTTVVTTQEEAELSEQEKENIYSEDIPKPSEKIEEIITEERSEELVAAVDVLLLCQNPNESCENTTHTDSKSNETIKDTVKGSNLDKIENLQNLENTEEELNTIKAKMDNVTSFTPRRSTRHASQSTDTPQASAELSFTPRRSTRRASMSAESTTATTTCTPIRKTTRRASLSGVNETPLTPKSLNKRRRSSVSLDSEIPQASTSKTQRAKTPRKQFEQRSVIPEEIDEEVVGEVIKEDEEELKAPEITKPFEIQTHQSVNIQEETREVVENKSDNIVLAEETSTEELTISCSNEPRELIELPATADVINSEEQQDNIDEILEIQGETEKTEKNQKVLTSNVVETTENQVTKDNLMLEEQQKICDNNETQEDTVSPRKEQNTDKVNIETTDNSNSIKATVESNIVKDVTNDNLEDSSLRGLNTDASIMMPEDETPHHTESDEKVNTTADKTSESRKATEIPAEILKTSSCSATSTDDKTRMDETENMKSEEKSIEETLLMSAEGDLVHPPEERQGSGETEKLEKTSSPHLKTQKKLPTESPKTPVMTGVRELLKTPKVEAQTPRLGGIRDMVRSPKPDLENEDEEIEKLAVVADLTRTPTTNVAEISTPKTKKLVTIVADSPKTPVMTGVRELLKTPKAEPRTPRLGGIRNLVRSPKPDLENEDEEIEKLAVAADLTRTPPTNVAKISTPKTKKHVTIVADSPKTPVMTGVRELLKTPKAGPQTPRLGGIRDLVRTPKADLENEDEEIEKLAVVADLTRTPTTNVAEISTPKTKKHVTIVADSPKTPVMTGVRELLKTPKKEMITPKLSGIRNLVRTPKLKLEDEQEEIEKLAVVAELCKTPDVSIPEDMPTSSIKSGNFKGVKEQLLKTPKSCTTPNLRGIRELMQTPKTTSTPITITVKEPLETPVPKEALDLQSSIAEITENPKRDELTNSKAMSTLRQQPKMSSTPLVSGVKSFMDAPPPAEQNVQELEQFLKTPTAKNIMIPSMPSSAVMEKSGDSIEISTEYDLNATTEAETPNLEELFKTPMSSRYVERITASYYGHEELEQNDEIHKTLQDTLNKSAEEAFDKLIGQESQIHTPMRKRYTRQSFTLKTPHSQSPFTASDVLSDLPKTDVEEWIETLEQAEPPTILECDDGEEDVEELTQQDIINESERDIQEMSLNEENSKNQSFNESVIPETCTKVYITENTLRNKSNASLTYTVTKDPLSHTKTQLDENPTSPLVTSTSVDAEISGIDLLDQTLESVHEEPSMFEEHLEVSDNESEVENVLEISQDEGLSEPLLLSDSEDLNVSQETKNQCEIKQAKDQELQTHHLDVNVAEKSMLEKLPNKIDPSLAQDPLETGEEETSVIEIKKENKTLVELDANLADNNWTGEETVDEDGESIYNIDMAQTCDIITQEQQQQQQSFLETELTPTEIKDEQRLVLDEYLPKQLFATDENIENVKQQETTEELEIFSTSQITDEILQTSLTDETEKESDNNLEINLINETLNAKEISIEQTRIKSTESENIFVDTTVNEICDETNTQNQEEHVEGEESVELKNYQQKSTSYECQNIFMENSNIDESFAHEAANENVIDNESHNFSLTPENENGIKDLKKETIAKQIENEEEEDEKDSANEEATEIVEKNKTTERFVTAEETDVDHVIVLVEEESTESDQVTQSKLSDENESEIAEETQEVKQTNTTTQYEMAELPTQIEVQSIETSLIEVVSLDEKQMETMSSEISITKMENTEIQSSETLVTKMESSVERNKVETKSSEPTEELTQVTDVLTDNSTANEEDMKPSTSSVIEPKHCITQSKAETAKVLSETPQSVIENSMNEENITTSVCELEQNAFTATAETIEKVSNENLNNSSTESHSNEVLTDTSAPKLIEDSEQTPVKSNDVKTTKEVEIEKEKSLEIGLTQTSEINIKEKTEKYPQPLQKAEYVARETINDFEEKLIEVTDVVSPNEQASSISTKISLNKQLPGSPIEKVKPSEKSTDILIATSEVLQYDSEIKINDLDDPTAESNTEMPDSTRKYSKTPVAKHAYCSPDEKDFNETGQETEVNEIAMDAVKRGDRNTRTVSESSQDSTHREEKSTSTRRERRKIAQKISELVEEVEEINDQQQTPKDITPVIAEKDEKRKRATSDSSQGSVKDDENYALTRRGGRRKVKKVPIQATVVEQKEEAEEFLLKATVREEQKTNAHIPSTEEKAKEKQRIVKVIETESNQELTSSEEAVEETVVEPLDEVEKTQDKDLNANQSVVTTESVANFQEQVRSEEKQSAFTHELHPDDQRSVSSVVNVAELHSKIEAEEHLTATLDQVSLKEEAISSVLIKKVKGEGKGNEYFAEHSKEKQEQFVCVSADELLTIPGELAHTTADKVKEEKVKVKQDEFENQDQASVSMVRKATRTQSKVQKTPVGEVVVVESLDKEEMAASSKTINEMHLGTEEISAGTGKEQPIDSADNEIFKVKSVTLEVQKETSNLHRSKSKAAESRQAIVNDDDTTRTRRGRRGKVQKTPTEDIVIEEKTSEPVFSTKTAEELQEFSNEKTKNKTKFAVESPKLDSKLSEQDQKQGSVQESTTESIETHKNQEFTETVMMEDKTKEIPKEHKESKDMTYKRGRNKQNSQETVSEEPTTTRKGRRKLQVSTAEVHSEEPDAKISQVENEVQNVTTAKNEHKDERLEVLEVPPETKTNTKHTGRRGRHYKIEAKESPAEKAANEEDTIPTTSHEKKLESVQTDVPLKEIEAAATNEEQLEELPEVVSIQEETGTDKAMIEQESSTKKPVKRGRPRKKEVEGDAKLQEEITTQHTRRGGRHITLASETTTATTTAALPKGRSSNRKNKTPTEHSSSTSHHQLELSEVIEKPEEETDVEVFKVRSRSKTNKTPAEQEITSSEQQEQKSGEESQAKDSLEKVAVIEVLNNSTEEDLSTPKGKELSDVRTRVKRTRTGFETRQGTDVNEKPAKKRARHQINETEESHEEDLNQQSTSPQIQKTENIQTHEEEDEIEKDIEEKQQKTTTTRKAAPVYEERVTHHKELSIKSKGRRAAHEESETQRIQAETEESEKVYSESMEPKKTTTQDVSLSEVQKTEANLEPEESLNQNVSAEEKQAGDKIKRGRRKAILEENLKEDHEILSATKRRGVAAVKNIKQDHNESSSSTKRLVGRKKQVEEEEEEQEDKAEVDLDDPFETNKKIKDDRHNVIDKEEEKQSESEVEEESKHTENNEAIGNRRNIRKNRPENEAEDLEEPHEETKKGKGRRQKTDHEDKIEQVTASQSPETKRRGRKRKESHAETHDHTTKEQDQSDANLTKEPETKTSSTTEDEISQRAAAPPARRGRKAIEHITAESQELEDTPGKRARNVPQRRAATAYHNYDETSDSEVLTKTKKKTDSPKKSLEAVVNTPPTVTITSAAITTLSSSPVSSTTPATTARGRTRKPTAKVQQFLEKQRAKAETPKKRGLLAAVAGNDTATPQGTPARRGRKPSTIETDIEGTPQVSKARGRAKLAAAAVASHTIEDHSDVPEIVTVIEEKEIEAHAGTPQSVKVVKGRRGGRKAKITEEEPNSSDEPPAKKSPLELENEKQDTTTPLVETATPTRTAGRRNAAAAAKARIEEDALAAAAIEPPKRPRARKAPIKFATPLAATTDTEAHSSEVESEEQTGKDEKVEKGKNASQLREHRLASASTIEGVEDLEDIEIETKLKPVGRRGRKAAAAVTDSPAVPVKRGRKPKIVEEVTASETSVEPKTSRGRGRGRKNVHFDEHNEAEASSSSQKTAPDNESSSPVASTSETAKKVTRTRRK